MRPILLAATFLPLAFVLGCSGADSSSSGATTEGGVTSSAAGGDSNTSSASTGGGSSEQTTDYTYQTGKFEAPPGESFNCFYLDAETPKELSVISGSGDQGLGGHHILIFWTDSPRPEQHHTCTNQEMVAWHQIAGAAGHGSTGGEGIVTMPAGLAIKVPAHKQLVIQSHYINATDKTETVNDSITMHTVDPKEVKAYANYFDVLDESFEVPPAASLTHVTSCTTDRDLENVVMLGHMHEYGIHYTLAKGDGHGKPTEVLYDHDWEPLYSSHPPINYFPMAKPMHLPKGTELIQTCTWHNTTVNPLTFPDEMCIGFFYYFPDAGEITCNAKAIE